MKSLSTLIFLLASLNLLAQSDYYWVGGTGNWSDYSNHWATTSGGTTFHTQAPTSLDDVYFDANSFATTSQVVTLDVVADFQSMDWTGVLNFPSIVGNGNDLNVYGSLTLSPDMTAGFSDVNFESTSIGNTITSNGTSLGASSIVRFNGIGGEWTLQDNLTTNNLYVVAGTLNTNNNNINAGDRFNTSGASAKTLNLGSSQITAVRWWMQGTNQTINAGTSKIIVSSFYSDPNGDGPFTYYDVEFFNYGVLYYNSTFNEITVPAGLELTLRSGDTFTVGNLIANGTKYSPIVMNTTTAGSEATFSAGPGSITLDYVEMQDIHASGGATFTANNSVDYGNNTGWTINAPATLNYYWVGNSGNWSDFANHWATTSGGSTFHPDYPGRNDNVYFDANSFSSAGQTVTIDINAECGDMDWTGATNSPILSGAFAVVLSIFGSATFTNEVDKAVYNAIMRGSGTHTITYAAKGDFQNFGFEGTGSFTLQDSVFAGNLQLFSGTINLNGQPFSAVFSIDLNGSATTLNAGSSNIYCKNFNINNSSSTPTFNEGTSTLTITDGVIDIQSTSNRSFSFYNLILEGTNEIEGSHTIQNLTVEPGADISFEESTTQTVNGSLNLTGTKAAPITLNSTLGGTQATLTKASGTVDAVYLILQDMTATGGATFYATETIDNGNNIGWNITGLTGADYYWVGDGGDWSDFANHWATTSGGSTFHVAVPGVLDNIIFDANSFSIDNEFVIIDEAEANVNDIDASTVDQTFILSGSGKELNIYGSVDMPALAVTNVSTYNFLSTGAATLSFNNGPGLNEDANFLSNGTWTLTSALSLDEMTLENGTLNTDGQNVTIDLSLYFQGSDAKTLSLGTSNFHAATLNTDLGDNITIDGGSSEVSFSGQLILEPANGTYTFNNVTVASGIGFATIYNDLDVNRFTIEAGATLKPVGSIVITTTELVAVGTAMDPIIMEPQVGGASLTFSQATGIVDAHYLQMQDVTASGGATFNAFESLDNGGVIGWIFHRDPQTITFNDIPNKTYGDAPFDISATASSGLTVAFEVISGPATVAGSTVTLTGAGTVQIKATQDGNIGFDPAPSVTKSFDVAKAGQSITFESIPTKTYGDAPFDISATASSGLTVAFEVISGPATVAGSTVTLTGAGTVQIKATQDGNIGFDPAPSVTKSFDVAKAGQLITFESIPTKTYGDPDFDLVATGGPSINDMVFSISDPNVATISGSTVTIVAAGTATVFANQAADDNYDAATEVGQTLTVNKADQTISFEAISDQLLEGDTFTLSATASSGLTVSYSSSDETIATISGSDVTIVGAGSTTITATQAGDTNYNAAADVQQVLTVNKVDQTISFEAISDQLLEDDTLTLSATASSGLEVSFEIVSGPATVSSNVISFTNTGMVTVRVSQLGDNSYNPAPTVEQAFNIVTITGIDFDISRNFHLYPNPANNYIQLSGEHSSVKIVDVHGVIVYQSEDGKSLINISSLNSGTYNIIITDKKGKHSKKLLKK